LAAMGATPLEPAQLQAQALVLEEQQSWQELLLLTQQQRPWHAEDDRLTGYLDYLAGRALLEQRQPDQAEPLLRNASAALPEVPFTHNLLGRSLADRQNWLGAVAAQQRCISLKPDFGYAWLELGRAREALGDLAGAEAAFQRALPLLPDNTWLQRRHASLRITLLLRAGDGDAAATAIGELHRQGPVPGGLLQTWLELAAALLTSGKLAHASAVATAIATGAEQAACPSPLASRCPLLLQALALLLDQEPPSQPEPNPRDLAGALHEALWLPNDRREQAIWRSSLSGLLQSAGHRLSRITTPAPLELLPLLDSLAELAASRFEEPELALQLLQTALAWPGLSDPLRQQLAERAAEAALAAASAADAQPAEAWRLLSEVIRLLQPVPEGQRTARGRATLLEAHLGLAGHDLPADLLNLRTQVQEVFAAYGSRSLPGSLRRALDQLLVRLNHTVLTGTAGLARRAGQIQAAQELRRQGLELIAELTTHSLNPPGPAPLPRSHRPRRRWLLLASTDLPQCFLYRVQQKREQLESIDQDAQILDVETLVSWTAASALLGADVMVVCRLPGTYPVLRAIGLAQRFGIPVYYDIDDLIFDAQHFPPPLASYGGTISADLHTGLALDAPLFEAAMRQADGLIMSTPTLAQRWRELHPNQRQPVLVLPNLAPPALRREAAAARERLQQAPAAGAPRLLVSSGTLAHKQVWCDELAPALAEVLQRHPTAQLDLVGSIGWPEHLRGTAPGRIREIPFSDYTSYLRHLSRAQIGLAPLEPGIVTDAKSAIKWMEYSLMGLATVVSPTATYREVVETGVHGLVASDRQGWVNAIERLISNPQLRQSVAQQAHQRALELFGSAAGQGFWQQLQAGESAVAAPARRVLLINCFFAPQSVGGATRVAQDRVRELLASGTAEQTVEVTVLCTDLEPWQGQPADGAMPLDAHDWFGARVVRLGLPAKPWDLHHDGEVEQFCREWFQREGFDEIEAHAVQILTAAPLRVAQSLGIPYRVVLHDGWWLSRLQFLTRDDGTPVDPQDPRNDLDPEADDAQKNAVMERRRDLLEILAGADERLAVSESFADLYRQAGVRKVGVRRNRSPEAAQAVADQPRPQRHRDEPVRYCMVGGMAVHKGYAVLRAAIQAAQLGSGASFTVVDHRLKADNPGYHLRWGGSAVAFIPPLPMDRMPRFYASQEVLIAPSIWPESFGLVTREALAAGLWVIASRAGALAEPIQHGVNGLVVEPGSIAGLQAALTETMNRYHIG
jgi:glycosyltransferase involved in cell wall biosynthesis